MAAPMDSTSSVPEIDWLYPELMSKDGLVAILSQRYVKLPEDLENMIKEDLLELYYRYVIPRPQRKYRLNLRGREMTKKQVHQSKKRKMTAPADSEPALKKRVAESSRLLTSFDDDVGTIAGASRLKPPPSCVNVEKRVIKLGLSSSSTAAATSSSQADNFRTVQIKPIVESPAPRKIIRLNCSTSPSSSDAKSSTSPIVTTERKTVKQVHSSIKSPSGDADCKSIETATNGEEPIEISSSESENTSEKKRKINKISWP